LKTLGPTLLGSKVLNPGAVKTIVIPMVILAFLDGKNDEVAETGQSVVITKNGRAVAQLGPVISRPRTLAGAYKGKIHIAGDILAPVPEQWEAQS